MSQKNTTQTIDHNKILYLELLRIISAFLVIANHIIDKVVLARQPSPTWVISLIYLCISKIAVPVFVMIAGVNLLIKEEPFKKTLSRFFKTFIVLIAASLFYIFYYYQYSLSFSLVWSKFSMLLNQLATGPFWYLYMYLGLLLMIPFIRIMIREFKDQHYFILFSLYIIVYGVFHITGSFVPQLKLSSYFLDIFFNPYIVYIIAGYYIHYKLRIEKVFAKFAMITFIISIGAQTILTYLYYKLITPENYLFLDYPKSALVGIAAACLFYLLRYWTSDIAMQYKSSIFNNLVILFGSCTFGIYIFSNYVIHKFNKNLFPFLENNFQILIAVLIFNIFVFVFSFIITYVLKKIPIVKNYI